MNCFVFVPRPMPFESPTSVLIRTAQKNGFLNVRHMSNTVLKTGANRWLDLRLQSGSLFKLLCTEAPTLAEDLRKVFYDQPRQPLSRGTPILVDGHEVSVQSLTPKFRPCAHCVNEGYTRSPQDLIFFETCPYHNAPLITQCPACSAQNHWYDIKGFTCLCGFNFKDSVGRIKNKLPHFPLKSSFGQQNLTSLLNKQFADHLLRRSFVSSNCQVPSVFFVNPFIKSLIKKELNTYCKLPLRAFEAPWHRLREENLRFEILDYLHQFNRKKTECRSANCCSTVRLNFLELSYACNAEHPRVREMIQRGVVDTINTPNSNEIYYGSSNLCAIIREELDKRINSSYSKSGEVNYLTASQTADKLRTTKTAILNLIDLGFFEGALKNHRAHFIPKKTVDEILANYITTGEIAENYGVSSKTISTLLRRLGTCHILESLDDWIPSIYFRREIKKTLTSYSFSALRPHSYRGIPDEEWLSKKSAELSLDLRSLKDLLRNYFKWLPPYSRLSPEKNRLIDVWRSNHHSYAEVIAELGTTHETIGTRFHSTNLINPETWGITNYLHSDDVARMKEHLNSYYSVSQAAEALAVGRNTIYSLIDKGILKTGTPLFSRARRKIIMIIRNQDAFKLPLPHCRELLSPYMARTPSKEFRARLTQKRK